MGCRRPVWLPAVLLLSGSWLALAALSMQPHPEAKTIAAVFPPWWTGDEAFAAAASTGAAIIRPGAFPTILVLRPEGGLARLYAAGAWLALDPVALGGCLTR